MSFIYIASPYNHPDQAVMQKRHDEVCAYAGMMISRGWCIFSPIAHNVAVLKASDIKPGWQNWQRFDLDMLERAEQLYVFMLDGWQQSKGVRGEMKFAKSNNIPIQFVSASGSYVSTQEGTEAFDSANSLKGVEVSDWIVIDKYCATRVLKGTNQHNVDNRVAFIEKTPRVLHNTEWIEGPKGSGGGDPKVDLTYGFDPESRAWCDDFLRERGAILP